MKILLLGSGGLLGRYLASELAGHTLTAQAHQDTDISDASRLDQLFAQPWDAVINAAAVCDFDACEKDPAGTGRINREAPLDLARRCAAQDALFVQYSSDYVFGGADDRLLSEAESPHPLSVYGGQKADLEALIPSACPRSLILRVSWLYGLGGKTFMSRLPDLLSAQTSLRTAAGKKGCSLYAGHGALWTRQLVEAGQTGLLNLVNPGVTSWEEFAGETLTQMTSLGLAPKCRDLRKVPYEKLGPDWAKRPRYSSLDGAQLAATFPPGPTAWREALGEFLFAWKSVAAPQTV